MRNYYNDITLNNLAMISTLKEEIKVRRERNICTILFGRIQPGNEFFCLLIQIYGVPRLI